MTSERYDFASPSTLPADRLIVVRRGVAWMIIGRFFPVEYRPNRDQAIAHANKVAKARQWSVEVVASPDDDL